MCTKGVGNLQCVWFSESCIARENGQMSDEKNMKKRIAKQNNCIYAWWESNHLTWGASFFPTSLFTTTWLCIVRHIYLKTFSISDERRPGLRCTQYPIVSRVNHYFNDTLRCTRTGTPKYLPLSTPESTSWLFRFLMQLCTPHVCLLFAAHSLFLYKLRLKKEERFYTLEGGGQIYIPRVKHFIYKYLQWI